MVTTTTSLRTRPRLRLCGGKPLVTPSFPPPRSSKSSTISNITHISSVVPDVFDLALFAISAVHLADNSFPPHLGVDVATPPIPLRLDRLALDNSSNVLRVRQQRRERLRAKFSPPPAPRSPSSEDTTRTCVRGGAVRASVPPRGIVIPLARLHVRVDGRASATSTKNPRARVSRSPRVLFINASARAGPRGRHLVRSSVRSFVRSRLPSSRSSPIASAPPRVQITSHDRRARASGTRARARRDDKRRPTDRPTTDAWKVPDVRIYVPVLYSQNDQVPISYTHVTHGHIHTPLRSQNPSRTHSSPRAKRFR